MWPDHCVQGTHGAMYHKDLVTSPTDIQINKGTDASIDAFSVFGCEHNDTGFLK